MTTLILVETSLILDADNGNQLIKAMRFLAERETSSQELLDHTVQGMGAGVVVVVLGGGGGGYVGFELLVH